MIRDGAKLHIMIDPDIIAQTHWDNGATDVDIIAATYSQARNKRGAFVTIGEDGDYTYKIALQVLRAKK